MDRRIATGTRRRPGRARALAHRAVGVAGWIVLVGLAVWRLPEAPPWSLPLPVGLLVLGAAAALVACALVWARTADRRRRPRPVAPTRRRERPRVPERV
jgi:hypothetical protein